MSPAQSSLPMRARLLH